MKGIVFREFIEMVENEFSYEIADAIIAASELSTAGAYTSVGTYPHTEMVSLVVNLSKQTGQPVPALLNHFGRHLFKRLYAGARSPWRASPVGASGVSRLLGRLCLCTGHQSFSFV